MDAAFRWFVEKNQCVGHRQNKMWVVIRQLLKYDDEHENLACQGFEATLEERDGNEGQRMRVYAWACFIDHETCPEGKERISSRGCS